MSENAGTENAAGVEGLTVAEVADRAHVTRWTVSRWIQKGRVKVWYRTPSGLARFDPRTIDAQLRQPP